MRQNYSSWFQVCLNGGLINKNNDVHKEVNLGWFSLEIVFLLCLY